MSLSSHMPHFAVDDPARLRALMAGYPLGTWMTTAPDGSPRADHVPFLFDATRGEHGALLAHVSRANPVWRDLAGAEGAAGRSLVVFHGPQAYVSPSWYPGKQAHGKVVPTWNYAVVHVHGRARAIDDRAGLLALLERLTAVHERAMPAPWGLGDAPPAFIDQLLGAIVGIEIAVERIEGRFKMSQNRSAEDRAGVVAGLQDRGDADAAAVAALVRGAA